MADNAAQPTPTTAPHPPLNPLRSSRYSSGRTPILSRPICRAGLDDPSAVDDLFQETMLIAWQKITAYDRLRPFGAWLRGIARNSPPRPLP